MIRYLAFRVGQEWFGLEVACVAEVLQLMALNHVPGVRDDVLGLLTLRDVTMPVIDLRLSFGLDAAPLTLATPVISINSAAGPLAFVVDDVDDVYAVTDIADVCTVTSDFVSGSVRIDGRLLLIIDLNAFEETILSASEI